MKLLFRLQKIISFNEFKKNIYFLLVRILSYFWLGHLHHIKFLVHITPVALRNGFTSYCAVHIVIIVIINDTMSVEKPLLRVGLVPENRTIIE